MIKIAQIIFALSIVGCVKSISSLGRCNGFIQMASGFMEAVDEYPKQGNIWNN